MDRGPAEWETQKVTQVMSSTIFKRMLTRSKRKGKDGVTVRTQICISCLCAGVKFPCAPWGEPNVPTFPHFPAQF